MAVAIKEWFSSTKAKGWVERMILNESVDHPVPTEEYVVRHNLGLHRKAARPVDLDPMDSAASLDFLDRRRSESAVRGALDRLERNGLVERVDPPPGATEGEWWRLTDAGREEKERLRDDYESKLDALRLEYGIFEEQ